MEDTGAGAQSPFFSAASGHPGMGGRRQNGSGFGHGPSGMYGQAAMQGCVPVTPGVMPNFPQSQQMPGAPMQQSLHFGVSRTPIPYNGTMYGGSTPQVHGYTSPGFAGNQAGHVSGHQNGYHHLTPSAMFGGAGPVNTGTALCSPSSRVGPAATRSAWCGSHASSAASWGMSAAQHQQNQQNLQQNWPQYAASGANAQSGYYAQIGAGWTHASQRAAGEAQERSDGAAGTGEASDAPGGDESGADAPALPRMGVGIASGAGDDDDDEKLQKIIAMMGEAFRAGNSELAAAFRESHNARSRAPVLPNAKVLESLQYEMSADEFDTWWSRFAQTATRVYGVRLTGGAEPMRILFTGMAHRTGDPGGLAAFRASIDSDQTLRDADG